MTQLRRTNSAAPQRSLQATTIASADRAVRLDDVHQAAASAQQARGGGARLVGDGRAGEHAGDLLAARAGGPARRRGSRRGRRLSPRSLAIRKCAGARGPRPAARGSRPAPGTRSASRASRWPIASATAPPTPVSISSKTSVGAEPRSASTTFSASMKRDSSPPDATFISGPGRVPGLVCDPELDPVDAGPDRAVSGRSSISVMKRARSSFSGGSSAFTAASRRVGRRCARLPTEPRRPRHRPPRPAADAPSRGRRGAPRRRRVAPRSADEALAQARRVVGRHVVLARGGAQREQPLLGLLQLARVELGRADAPPRGRPAPRRGRRSAASSAVTLGSTRPGAWPPRRSQPAHGGGQLRQPASRAGDAPRSASLSSPRDLLGLHHHDARARRARLLAGLRVRAWRAPSTAWRRKSASRRAASMRARCSASAARGVAQPPRRPRRTRRAAPQAAEGVEQRAVRGRIDQRPVVVLAVDLDQRRADARAAPAR